MNPYGKWDSTADGRFDVSDLLATFDADADGALGKDELQHLAEQLSHQLEYNSTLLNQVHSLEQDKLNNQRDIQIKQDTIKRLSDNFEQASNELVETKRKLKIAQDVTETMAQQAKDMRLEISTTRRDVELAGKGSVDLKSQLDAALRESAELHRALVGSEQVIKKVNDESTKTKSDLQSQIDILQHMNDAINKEAADLRTKVFPLESEKRKLVQHIQDLSQSLEDTVQRCETEAEGRKTAQDALRDLSAATEKMRDRHMEVQYSLRESEDMLKAHKDRVQEHSTAAENAEKKLKDVEQRLTQVTQALQSTKEENAFLHQELEHMSNELVTQARIRQEEQDRVHANMDASKAEMERILNDTKAHADDRIRAAETRTGDAMESRQKIEAKYLAAQRECNDMHAVIEKMQHDNQMASLTWDKQKEGFTQTIKQQQKELLDLQANFDEMGREAVAEAEKFQSTLRAVKQDNAQKNEKMFLFLDGVQMTVKRLRDDFIAERSKVREIVGFAGLVKAKVSSLNHNLVGPVTAIRPELRAVFEKLSDKLGLLKDQWEDSKDDVRRAELAKEEERTKSLMLEERVSRLELDVASRDKAGRESEKRWQDKIAVHMGTIEQLSRDKADLETKIHLLQQTMQETTAHARNLQATNQHMQAAMGEATNKHTEVRQDVENKIFQLSGQLKRTAQERDDATQQVGDLKMQIAQQQRDLATARTQEQAAKSDLDALQKTTDALKDKHQLTMSAVGGATQKYQQQLKQSQDILGVVQAQRSELEARCQQLQAEVDQLHESMRNEGTALLAARRASEEAFAWAGTPGANRGRSNWSVSKC